MNSACKQAAFGMTILVLIGSCALAQAPQLPPGPVTLERAVEFVRANYPAIRAAQAQLAAANYGINLSRTAYLPRADSILLANRATRNNVFGMLLPQAVIPPISGPVLNDACGCNTWGSAAGLSFSWEPFDFGFRKANVDAASAVRDQASAAVALTQFDVVTRVAESYFDVLAGQEAVRAAEANVERMRVFYDVVSALARNQLRPGADESRARAELAAVEIQLTRLREALAVRRAELAERLGVGGQDIQVTPGVLLQAPGQMPAPALEVTSHPAAATQAAAIEVPRARYRALDRSYLPRFSFQSGFSSRGAGARPDGSFLGGLNGLAPSTGNWGVGFSVSFPLFDSPIIRERQRIESELERAESARYDDVVQQLQADAARARARLESARQIAANTPVQLEAARTTEQQSRVRYQAGLATIIEVADAQRLLTQAEIDESVATLGVWRALFEQSAAGGDIEPFLRQMRSTP